MRVLTALAIAVAVVLLPAGSALAAPAWLPAAAIPGEVTPAREAQVAFGADGTLVVVWHGGAGGTQTINTATRPPGGSFGAIDTLAGPAVGIGSPRVAVDGQGTTLVTWVQGAGARFSIRPPGGSFSAAADVPRPVGEGVNSAVEVAFDPQGNALAAWVGSQSMGGGFNIFLRASVRPAGGSFADPPEALDSGFDNRDAIGTPAYILNTVSVTSAGAGDLIASWARSCCLVGSETSTIRTAVRPSGGPFNPTETVASGVAGTDVGGPQVAGSAQGAATVVWSKMLTATTGNVSSCTRPPGGSFAGCAIENVSGDGTPTQFAHVGVDAQGNAVAAWIRKLPVGTGFYAVQTSGRAAGAGPWTPLGTFAETGVDFTQPALAVSPQGAALVAWRRGMEWIEGASRVAGAAFGPSQPLSASVGNPVFPDVAMDPAGNGAAAWERIPPADTVVEVAGFDGAGPVLSGLSIPASGDTGKPLAFAAAASDVWSPVQSIDWTFGDGGPVSGAQVSHTYGGVGGNLTVSVTASDSLGNATTATRPIRIRDAIRPVLSRLRMTHRRFAVGRARTPLVARRVPRGSAFRFRLSERAKVTIRLERRVGRRYRKVKILTRRGLRGGANTLRFSGRIKRKALPPGRYHAKLRAVDRAGNRSRPRITTFVISAPRTR
jgi:hypothetical protein